MPVIYLHFLITTKKLKKIENVSESALIVQSITTFVQEKLRTSKGCQKKYDKEAMMAMLTACMNNLGDLAKKNNIREAIGMSKKIIQV